MNQSFITAGGNPCGIAVDAAHVYWANINDGTIGRANLDGSGVNQSFVVGANLPCGVAVDAGHLYWSNGLSDTIGRANLDGTGVDQSFIGGANLPCGVAVDAGHLYWANGLSETIGRANLDGSRADQVFIDGANRPCGVAVDRAHLYWANGGDGTIGRANLDGTGANQSFIGGAMGPCGVAVDARTSPSAPRRPSSPPSNGFNLAKPKLNHKRGTARLAATVPAPGELALSGNGVKAAGAAGTRAVSAPGAVQLLIKAAGMKRRKLNETGKVTVTPRVTYTPTGGDPSARSRTVKLVKL